MALDQLLASIEDEARAEIEAELARGRNEATRITTAAAEQEARVRRDALATEQARRQQELDAELALARLRARQSVLHARQRFIDRVLAAVEKRLPAVALEARYLETLAAQYEKSLDYARDASVAVRAATSVTPRLRELAAQHPSVSIEADASIATGFEMATSDGVFVVDATLEGALAQWRREITIELLRRMEGAS